MIANDLKGKIAVVTGASRGIGKGIARALADVGARVACIATTAENAAESVAEIRAAGGEAIALGCRVEDASAVTAAFSEIEQQLGSVDILVNNAGISRPQPLLEMTEENWDAHMDINAKSVFLCAQAAIRQMKKSGNGGCVINIGSIVGQNAIPQTLGYCASKAAVDHMTRVMAVECAKYGVRVNCIAPGYVRTELIEQLAAQGKLALAAIEQRTPQRRLGSIEEIAAAVIYVASPAAEFMTGSVINIDGGWTAYGYL
ncbi:MAG: 3-oxoacyl-ACP reductase FabG [Proteobacteria bacterium]|nr:MAG: 3-oxoacyl-ACP reductase FabG [Pseudomonadota bacterium]